MKNRLAPVKRLPRPASLNGKERRETVINTVEYYFKKLDPKLTKSINGSMIGVRMAMYGSQLAGVDPSKGDERKNLYVFVENYRRFADSISIVTGCTVGNRRLRIVDNGLMAASFVNVKSETAARLVCKMTPQEIYDLKPDYGSLEATMAALPDERLFDADMNIQIEIDFYDRPGAPKKKIPCDSCGVRILDNKQVRVDDQLLCRPCSGDVYWRQQAAAT